MPNMSLKKSEMPSQEPNVRNKNFLEVALSCYRGAGARRSSPLLKLQEPSLRLRLPGAGQDPRIHQEDHRKGL